MDVRTMLSLPLHTVRHSVENPGTVNMSVQRSPKQGVSSAAFGLPFTYSSDCMPSNTLGTIIAKCQLSRFQSHDRVAFDRFTKPILRSWCIEYEYEAGAWDAWKISPESRLLAFVLNIHSLGLALSFVDHDISLSSQRIPTWPSHSTPPSHSSAFSML